MIALKNETNLLVAQGRALFWLELMHRGLAKKVFATPGVIVHAENVEKRRFPGAGRAHDGNEFPFREIEIDIAQDVKEFALRQRINAFQFSKFNHIARNYS
jgi:hypothetical protein